MFEVLVGLTAIDVSLCGPTEDVSQSVLAFGPDWVAVVQIAVPVLTAGPDPNTALGTGAGALIALWVKSTGCGPSSPRATSANAPNAITRASAVTTATAAPGELSCMRLSPFHPARPAAGPPAAGPPPPHHFFCGGT